MQRTTLELQPGDRVRLGRTVVRTVATVTDSGYVNAQDAPIYSVRYVEGDTAEWSAGNSGTAASVWDLDETAG